MIYKVDLHVHTRYSYDSLNKLSVILERAKRVGLSAVAITDHNEFEGALKAEELADRYGVDVILGQEVKTEYGDIIGLFLKRRIESKLFSDVVKEIRSQDGLIVLPHPYKKSTKLNSDIIDNVDAVEVFNGRVGMKENRLAAELARKHKKPIVCGSDAHTISEVGRSHMCFENKIELKKQILAGRGTVMGKCSHRYVHYISSLIGNYRKGRLIKVVLWRLFR